ncbi:hypothetical protein BC937DRAFT_95161 [Endogone sp. FLAS-F59071]|nr:hypothetical protein BC937DRAFT_95161 [Endogone sp. FLAS-F59071]|eukprot:RUS20460.1 hypothetical protein BC937DRAFT_95161 [Endogone sp. FLAS-F59071]
MARILSRVKCTPASTKRLAENIANAAPVVVLSVIIMWSYLAYVFSLSGVLMMTKPVQATTRPFPLTLAAQQMHSIPMHNDSTTFASPRPSTDHESEALQPLTTEAMFVQEGHQSAATVSHAESPFSTSTANLLRLSHARNGLGVGSGAVFGRQQTMMVKENGQRRCVLKMDQ